MPATEIYWTLLLYKPSWKYDVRWYCMSVSENLLSAHRSHHKEPDQVWSVPGIHYRYQGRVRHAHLRVFLRILWSLRYGMQLQRILHFPPAHHLRRIHPGTWWSVPDRWLLQIHRQNHEYPVRSGSWILWSLHLHLRVQMLLQNRTHSLYPGIPE